MISLMPYISRLSSRGLITSVIRVSPEAATTAPVTEPEPPITTMTTRLKAMTREKEVVG